MKAHVISNGKVVNTIIVNSLDDLPSLISAENGGTIGDTWDGETFTTPVIVPPVPQSVTRFQARGALLLAGLLDGVETAMAACSDEMAKLAWQYAQEFRRDSPTIAVMAAAIGITDAQLDDLFTVAAGIEA